MYTVVWVLYSCWGTVLHSISSTNYFCSEASHMDFSTKNPMHCNAMLTHLRMRSDGKNCSRSLSTNRTLWKFQVASNKRENLRDTLLGAQIPAMAIESQLPGFFCQRYPPWENPNHNLWWHCNFHMICCCKNHDFAPERQPSRSVHWLPYSCHTLSHFAMPQLKTWIVIIFFTDTPLKS